MKSPNWPNRANDVAKSAVDAHLKVNTHFGLNGLNFKSKAFKSLVGLLWFSAFTNSFSLFTFFNKQQWQSVLQPLFSVLLHPFTKRLDFFGIAANNLNSAYKALHKSILIGITADQDHGSLYKTNPAWGGLANAQYVKLWPAIGLSYNGYAVNSTMSALQATSSS